MKILKIIILIVFLAAVFFVAVGLFRITPVQALFCPQSIEMGGDEMPGVIPAKLPNEPRHSPLVWFFCNGYLHILHDTVE